ncbi:uncharacterized protein (TIGR00255 family) [Rhodovulum imhoffii]|uniref:Uncharacterized protein (TIGR00255 family) n=1 Tax=Rhodovulum imhoffii TaxID=365340 RepID=A0A2T5BTN9_9RHOB|nr:YicC/YloC family endoribonuclease [Rhodovulum imhoffii]MBK5934130.1 YicC family protein [Rhodovulum imhoffii]PTN02796.1 uncharacterized protein (TIGR00255 family) [Rhodovulum imhoffii]
MVKSMTAFATRSAPGWTWDIRGVNGRGLDLRLRLPEGMAAEQSVRKMVASRITRGNISLTLRLTRETVLPALTVVPEALSVALVALRQVQDAAEAAGVTLAPASAAEVIALRGVMDGTASEASEPLVQEAMDSLPALLDAFIEMRAAEGRALAEILAARLDEIAALTAAARTEAAARAPRMAETLRANLARVLENADGIGPDRIAQELALIAIKSDVQEELDRLDAHIAAARALLKATAPVGRKLDFLTQEFNREANTLCSKAQSETLTRIGIEIKSAIDQMREQVQNVE